MDTCNIPNSHIKKTGKSIFKCPNDLFPAYFEIIQIAQNTCSQTRPH